MGSSSGKTETKQTSDPWSAQQPYLKQAFSEAQNLYENNNPQYYPDSTVASQTPMQEMAINMQAARAVNGSPVTDASKTALTGVLNSNTSDLPGYGTLQQFSDGQMYDNPEWQSVVNKTMASTLPSLTSQFVSGNRMNDPNAAYAVSSGLGDAIGNLAYQNYNQQQQNQLSAAGKLADTGLTQQSNVIRGSALAPTVANQDYTDIGQLAAAGQTQQDYNQQQLDDQVSRWNYNQTLPYEKLNQYLSQIGGSYGNSTTLSTPTSTNKTASALGGAASGAAIGTTIMPGWGTAVGGGVGLLAGLFG